MWRQRFHVEAQQPWPITCSQALMGLPKNKRKKKVLRIMKSGWPTHACKVTVKSQGTIFCRYLCLFVPKGAWSARGDLCDVRTATSQSLPRMSLVKNLKLQPSHFHSRWALRWRPAYRSLNRLFASVGGNRMNVLDAQLVATAKRRFVST